jgi:hypothetical protein
LITNEQQNTCAGGAVVVLRIQDEQGVAIQKLSQQYRLRGAYADIEHDESEAADVHQVPGARAGHVSRGRRGVRQRWRTGERRERAAHDSSGQRRRPSATS